MKFISEIQVLVYIGYQASVISITASHVVNREHGGWGMLMLLVHFEFELKEITFSCFETESMQSCYS